MYACKHHDVRTTLTIEDDVAAKLRSEMRRGGGSFKETVNRLLRMALNAPPPMRSRRPFVVHARPLGHKAGIDYDNIGELIEQIEGPAHR